MKFSIKDFFGKCDQIRSLLQIWSNLLKKSLMENFIFCAVSVGSTVLKIIQDRAMDINSSMNNPMVFPSEALVSIIPTSKTTNKQNIHSIISQ